MNSLMSRLRNSAAGRGIAGVAGRLTPSVQERSRGNYVSVNDRRSRNSGSGRTTGSPGAA